MLNYFPEKLVRDTVCVTCLLKLYYPLISKLLKIWFFFEFFLFRTRDNLHRTHDPRHSPIRLSRPKKHSRPAEKILYPREQISKDQYQFSKGGLASRLMDWHLSIMISTTLVHYRFFLPEASLDTNPKWRLFRFHQVSAGHETVVKSLCLTKKQTELISQLCSMRRLDNQFCEY